MHFHFMLGVTQANPLVILICFERIKLGSRWGVLWQAYWWPSLQDSIEMLMAEYCTMVLFFILGHPPSLDKKECENQPKFKMNRSYLLDWNITVCTASELWWIWIHVFHNSCVVSRSTSCSALQFLDLSSTAQLTPVK